MIECNVILTTHYLDEEPSNSIVEVGRYFRPTASREHNNL